MSTIKLDSLTLAQIKKPHSLQESPMKILTTWMCCRDYHRALTQMYNNCAETHLSGGVLSPFVFSLYVAVRALATTTMRPNTIACVNKCFAKLFSVW